MRIFFVQHAYLKFIRSAAFSKELAKGIFMGFLALAIVGYSLGLGFALDTIITQYLKQKDSILFINKVMLYYFGFEFVMRYFLQNLPTLDVQPYLHLPIKRSSIAHHLLTKSLVHVFNCSACLLFTPFTLFVVAPRWGTIAALTWLGTIITVSLLLHYLIIYYKKKWEDTRAGILMLIGTLALFGTAEYYKWFELSDVSAAVFHWPSGIFFVFICGWLLLLLLYWVNFRVFAAGMYGDEWSLQKDSSSEWRKYSDWRLLRGFGAYGEWINLEIKSILRNKRPRTFLFVSAFMLLYGLIFYRDGGIAQKVPSFALFAGTFVTGAFLINYGQLLFSWQSCHFDFTLTRPGSVRQFIDAKYWLLSASTLIAFVVTLPYAYFGWQIIFFHLALTLFNMGVNIFIIMNIAMWEPQKIDPTKGGTFNYEGVGAAQWVMAIPIMLGPFIFYLPFKFVFSTEIGILAVGMAGLTGLALRPYLLGLTTKRFVNKKYEIASGFRKN